MEKFDYAITQNGEIVLASNGSMKMIWNNLIGKNFQGQEYNKYIEWALEHGFVKGEIQLVEKRIIKDKFIIV